MGTLEQVDKEIKSRPGVKSSKYYAKVAIEGDSDIKILEADTAEALATQIAEVANGRRYEAQYYGVVLT